MSTTKFIIVVNDDIQTTKMEEMEFAATASTAAGLSRFVLQIKILTG